MKPGIVDRLAGRRRPQVDPANPNTNGGANLHPYGLHEFLELCEQVGVQPRSCVSEETAADFDDGAVMELPPHSLTVLRWEQ